MFFLLLMAAVPLFPVSGVNASAPSTISKDHIFPKQADSSAAVQQDAYILGPGDRLLLQMLDPNAQVYGGTLEILNDGTASLALLGSAQLSGLTISQATQWLTQLYGRYLIRPDLSLSLAQPRAMQVSVLGEVQTPGVYSLSPRGDGSAVQGVAGGGTSGLPTVVSAIQKAGGITLNSNIRSVTLRRKLPGLSNDVKQVTLDLAKLLQTGNLSQNPFLFDGDSITVARALDPLPEEVIALGSINLSPQTISVNIIGEVKAPGIIQLKANTPLVEAILKAGGPTDWRAQKSNVELVRINRNGSVTRQKFSLNYQQGVSNAFNPPLRDGDSVVVPRSFYGKAVDVLNQVVAPLGQAFNFYTVYCSLTNNDGTNRC
ncbi:SLBB domain-containing protein [Synechococcus sp. CS-1325]|uniref:SLBB domain-containing protein n=1 Tax=unclassified Synechococcus TaxID=2626047 RepID=UPI0021A6279D|nr:MULTISPECIES: SLBB domain-containing protein [unclassified Synechococcus]MCT0198199.1 SLBB domain-containing protein [Synechococcus sp. CS-1325]MCT0213716.1 SLBB domain-containing protein [Synechococcus sp. CS-1326]MCT0234065.1 SLBB domain-containing protein [Synechococcus sp. CS-1327]